MPKCADCGTIYPENLNRCPKCGSTKIRRELAEQIRCPNCGAINDNYSSKCWKCGYKLN